jgi:hypothetical protein
MVHFGDQRRVLFITTPQDIQALATHWDTNQQRALLSSQGCHSSGNQWDGLFGLLPKEN